MSVAKNLYKRLSRLDSKNSKRRYCDGVRLFARCEQPGTHTPDGGPLRPIFHKLRKNSRMELSKRFWISEEFGDVDKHLIRKLFNCRRIFLQKLKITFEIFLFMKMQICL